jgi:Ser/Thr protein kinase RdoA (MazF antagonist)
LSPELILNRYGITQAQIQPVGSGHIHYTYKVTAGDQQFILQRVNKHVFTQPEIIAANNRIAFAYLKQHYPNYLFPQTLLNSDGQELTYDEERFPWRLYPFIDNTITVDQVSTEEQACEAAAGFARLSRNLDGVNVSLFNPTLDRFHDLSHRYHQFEEALANTSTVATESAKEAVLAAQSFHHLVTEYRDILAGHELKMRVVHNDTKINNILFDSVTGKSVCVIDLDTLMPGYFIYDLGDMVRTFVSPVSEEERDVTKIEFRKNIYQALLNGYTSEMDSVLSPSEKKYIPFAGKMMTYIMALRFLADYLRGNTYYHITYPDQNLVRATNQLHLLRLMETTL